MRRLCCALFVIALLAAAGFEAWAGPAFTSKSASEKEPITSVRQLNQARYTVGVGAVSAALPAVKRDLPNAKVAYLDGIDGYMAVQQGKIDAYAFDRRQMELAIASGLKGVALLPENIGEGVRIAVGISPASKIEDLKGKLNRFLSELRADGTLDDMFRRWVVDGDRRMPEIELPKSPSLKLRVGTTGFVPPHSYYEGTALTGYDIELARRFAAWLGGNVEFKLYDYGGIIAAAATGDVDCVMANLNVTPERAEKIPFSDVLYTEDVALMVRGDAPPARAAAADAGAMPSEGGGGVYASPAQLNGKKIGVMTGSIFDAIVKEALPSAETLYFDTDANLVTALLSGKIDAFLGEKPNAIAMMARNDRLTYIPEYLSRYENAFFVAKERNAAPAGKGPSALLEELNGFIRQLRDDGTLAEMQEIWFGTDESKKIVAPYETFPAPNGTLRLAQDGEEPPFIYMRDERIVGYDMDILARFCEARGYGLEPVTMNFSGIIPAVQSGRCDIGGGNVTITAERSESVTFTEPIYSGGGVLIVRAKEAPPAPRARRYTSPGELDGKRIGVLTGSIFDGIVKDVLPSAEMVYFDRMADLAVALLSGKIDAIAYDEPIAMAMTAENDRLTYIPEYLNRFDYAFFLAKEESAAPAGKGPSALLEDLNAFIRQLRDDGTLAELQRIWFGADESKKTVAPYETFPAPNGVLEVAQDGGEPPFVYMRDNRIVGYDIDILARFCEARGYGLKPVTMNFAGMIPAVQSGRCDLGGGGVIVTAERSESVTFTEPIYSGGGVLIVRAKEAPAPRARRYTSLDELKGKRIGVQTGSIADGIVKEAFPSAEAVYLDTAADLVSALLAGKIDAFARDEPIAMAMTAADGRLTYIPEYLSRYENAFFVAKGGNAAPAGKGPSALLEELNAFIRQLRDDGTLAELQEIWFGTDESKKTIAPYETFPAPNGTLRLAQDGAEPPFVYMRDNKIVGYDIAVLARFCEARGYRLEPVTMNFAGMIPAVQSGRCDLGGGAVTITAERAESVTFTEPIYSGGGVMVVRAEEAAAPGSGRYASLDELDGKRIGVQTGSTFDAIALARLPKAQISYFNSYPDMAAAMEAGRIDGFPGDEPVLRMMAAEDNQLTILDEYMDTFDFGFVLPKTEAGDRLRDELDAYIASIQESGELKAVTDKWTGADEAAKTLPDYAAFPAPKGVLTLATEGAYPPMNYFREDKVVGLEIDLAARFCEANGYGLKVEPMNFDSILPAVQSGKCDFAAAGLSITEERKESVNFSRPYYSGGTVMAVLKDKGAAAVADVSVAGQKDGFLSDIKASFERTFIREGRWRLFVEGVGVTLLITALSIVCGTALGFGVYLLCRNGNPLANALTRFCVWLVQGMPMVVLLMILYYVAFSGVDISGVAVAVVAFTLTFGAAVYGMLRMGVGAIDRGQTEAAYALGYGNGRTFFRIILPQALPHFMPSYQGEVVALVKATAIVGYIAVQDLPKMGDIVRSRTYEAFFPLIAVAVLYFVMAGALNFLVRRAQTRLDPRRRRRENILRGIVIKAAASTGPGELS